MVYCEEVFTCSLGKYLHIQVLSTILVVFFLFKLLLSFFSPLI